MNIEELLKKFSVLCVCFEKNEEEKFKKRLADSGFSVRGEFSSPAIIHRNKTVTFINSTAAAMLFSRSSAEFEKQHIDIIKLNYRELSPENAKSRWNLSRSRFIPKPNIS